MDNIVTMSPPIPGVAKPGDLYVDLQSKQLWLGVDKAVDPSEAVLVSDIMAIQPAIGSGVNTALAYTDSQIATRAPTVHTHAHTAITDWTTAVLATVSAQPGAQPWAIGMICMYSGAISNIGVGNLVGWALCDGTNNTPDLRDHFIIGAGNKPNWPAPLATNTPQSPANDLLSGPAGAHTPVAVGTALSVAQLPGHQHTGSYGGSCSGNTGGQSQGHTHGNASDGNNFVTAGGNLGSGTGLGYKQTVGTSFNDRDHYHSFSGSASVSGTSDVTGSGATHTHVMNNVPDHQHKITVSQFLAMVPWVALAYIMRIQ